MLSLPESSRLPPPRLLLAPGTTRPAEKEQTVEAGSQTADVRHARPGPERAQPGGFHSWILLLLVMFITPGQGSQTEGQSTGGLRAQLSLSLGDITAFQCRSHFKLISLCIMFFKSFLNKTERQSVSIFWGLGKRLASKKWPYKASGSLWHFRTAPNIVC